MLRLIACALLVACSGEAKEEPDAALGAPDAFATPVRVNFAPGDALDVRERLRRIALGRKLLCIDHTRFS